MTTTVYLAPTQWATLITTEDVLITNGVEVAYAPAKPTVQEEGHYFRQPVVVPKGSKAFVRSGSLIGQKVKLSSLGSTAPVPIAIPVFNDNITHYRQLPGGGAAIELDGTATMTNGSGAITYAWVDDKGTALGTAAKQSVSTPGVYTVTATAADAYTIATNITVSAAG